MVRSCASRVLARLTTLSGLGVLAMVAGLYFTSVSVARQPRTGIAAPGRLAPREAPQPNFVYVLSSGDDVHLLPEGTSAFMVIVTGTDHGDRALQALLENRQLAVESGQPLVAVVIDLQRRNDAHP